jgi:hypothetical protein
MADGAIKPTQPFPPLEPPPRKPSASVPAALITHEQARTALARLLNSIYDREPRARFSIPVDDKDDDIVLMAYIAQEELRGRVRG